MFEMCRIIKLVVPNYSKLKKKRKETSEYQCSDLVRTCIVKYDFSSAEHYSLCGNGIMSCAHG